MIMEVSWDSLWTLLFWALTMFMVTALGLCAKWPLGIQHLLGVPHLAVSKLVFTLDE